MAESVVEDTRTLVGAQRPKRRTRMSAKRKAATDSQEEDIKKRRTFDNFYTFCSFVLEYEEKLASESRNGPLPSSSSVAAPSSQPPHSPINSAGESSSSSTPSSSDSSSGGSEASDDVVGPDVMGPESPNISENEEGKMEYTSDDESWNLVTCFCRRPFAGRPMIECSKCETWIHLFCAKIRKDHVPEVYVCPTCTKASN